MKRIWIAAGSIAVLITAMIVATPAAYATTSANLIVDGDAEAGHCTTDWTAATTIPGWTVVSGSPDVICYSVGTFTKPASPAPGTSFISPGNQGDGSITQTADVSSAATAIDGGSVTYNLSGWLGGWTTYAGYATVTATFLNAAGASIGTAASLPTVSAANRNNKTAFLARSATGSVPALTRSIRITVGFVNSSGESGYADNLSLTLSTAVTAPTLAAPASAVPSFNHVFLVMMENTDYNEVVNDPADTPYIHSLMSAGTSMANFHGVYHPSDENYLAIAGAETYTTGATYFPNINDPRANLGDALETAGKSWKAYEQGMGTPCNTTTQYDSEYEPDDAPFFNYTDISGNASRCAAHLFDTSQLTTDLGSASTTPAFSWIAADDYYDGEASGNGSAASLRVQDGWLQQTLGPIMSSPAWTTQKSLIILTWDEDSSEAGNHILTTLVGSQGSVIANKVSQTRYDHYSTGRTVEAALGLPSFNANDGYANPLNDAFTGGGGGGGGATSTLTTSTPSVPHGTPITFSYATPASTANAKNWIGIYPTGVTPGSQSSLIWAYTPGTSGTSTFATTSLAAGSYAAWYCYNDGYTVLAGPTAFTVS
jgi:hypothetical protein